MSSIFHIHIDFKGREKPKDIDCENVDEVAEVLSNVQWDELEIDGKPVNVKDIEHIDVCREEKK